MLLFLVFSCGNDLHATHQGCLQSGYLNLCQLFLDFIFLNLFHQNNKESPQLLHHVLLTPPGTNTGLEKPPCRYLFPRAEATQLYNHNQQNVKTQINIETQKLKCSLSPTWQIHLIAFLLSVALHKDSMFL